MLRRNIHTPVKERLDLRLSFIAIIAKLALKRSHSFFKFFKSTFNYLFLPSGKWRLPIKKEEGTLTLM